MLQEINNGRWHVESLSGTSPSGYIITPHITTCQQCTSQDDKVCTARECNFLCPHMYKCDDKCYHFNNGHICKHIHRVHSLSHIRQLSNPQTESSVTEDYPATANENHQESVNNADDECTSCLVFPEKVSDSQKGS